MFEAFQLHKSFPHRTLFHQLSFRLPKQGLVLITGESGSGKTTFLYGLQGLVPLSGKWIVNGVDVFALNREQKLEFRQRYIGVVYQNMMLIPHATVKETLQLAAHLKGVDLQSQRHILDQGLFTEVRMDQRIDSLSLGQKQRLSCYIASLGQPLYYLFDEPTTGLHLVNSQLIYAVIEKLAQPALVMLDRKSVV
jgi:ABC-type multidrug transport system ATPase subunit